MLDGELTDYVDDRASRQRRSALVGTVTTVYTRTNSADAGNVEVDVQSRTLSNQLRRVPLGVSDQVATATVPQVGDGVVVVFLTGESRNPVVVSVIPNASGQAPLARAGHWRHEWGSLYLEAEPADHSAGEPDVVRMGVKPDGVSDPTTEVAVDDSGSTTQISIDTDGDITVSADGDIVIDQGGTAAPVAVQDHTHDVTHNGDTVTTGTPNESGTQTEIE